MCLSKYNLTESDLLKFKHIPLRDEKGCCVPKHANYIANDPNSPLQMVINNSSLAGQVFNVKDVNGNIVPMSGEWLAGFVDSEGTFTFFVTKNKGLTLGYQIQAVFIVVQGEIDYPLLTAIANFIGKGTVNVNRKDKTSVRYQVRIVDPEVLLTLIAPLFSVAKLRTKKGDEFVVWLKWLKYLKENSNKFSRNPHLAIPLLEGIKELKYEGSPTEKSLKLVKTCNDAIDYINKKFYSS